MAGGAGWCARLRWAKATAIDEHSVVALFGLSMRKAGGKYSEGHAGREGWEARQKASVVGQKKWKAFRGQDRCAGGIPPYAHKTRVGWGTLILT